MAKNKNNFNGGLSGKFGNLVAYQLNGVTHIRCRPEFRNRKMSDSQLLAVEKFRFAARFLRNISDLVAVTFEKSGALTGRNRSLSQMITQGVEGDLPNLVMNFSQLQMAGGSLKRPTAASVAALPGGILDFSWHSSDARGKRLNDRSILIAYCEELDDIWYDLKGPSRPTGKGQLEVPFFSNKQVHTWVSFISEDGKRVADSVYAGMVGVV